MARAALLFAILLLVLNSVENFQEGGLLGLLLEARRNGTGGGRDGKLNSTTRTTAALWLFASRSFALQFALGFLAVGGLHALVLAIQLLADGAAIGLRSGASSVALSRVAHGLARRAGLFLAIVLGATNAAHRSFAVNSTFGACCLFTSHFTLRTRANRVANSRAGWIVALPAALRVALLSNSKSTQTQQKH